MGFLYSLVFTLLFPFTFVFTVIFPKTRTGIRARFGLYRADRKRTGRPRILMHGASAGDLLSLAPMIRELKARFPDCSIVLSTLTNSGYAMARERIKGFDAVVYAPYDLPFSTARTMRAIDPDILVLEYTEIWPNLIRAARRRGAKIALTNGRFSPKKLGQYRLFFRLFGNPLANIDLFLMREDEEAARALELGAPLDRVWVTGNTKFDALVPVLSPADSEPLRQALGFPNDAKVLIAGSTHEGEEPILLEVFRRLLADLPELRLVIAPRYVERAGRIAGLAESLGLTVALRTGKVPHGPSPQVVILDTIGELSTAYELATLVFVGGSFTTRGGQNILEPAAQGKPVLFGPHMDNFHDSVQVLVGRGGIQVNDADHLYRVASELLTRRDTRERLGEMAREAVLGIRGASARNAERMAKALAERAKAEGWRTVEPPALGRRA